MDATEEGEASLMLLRKPRHRGRYGGRQGTVDVTAEGTVDVTEEGKAPWTLRQQARHGRRYRGRQGTVDVTAEGKAS